MSILTGVVGRARSGKDTVANHLIGTYGFVRLAFADKIKEILSSLYGVPMECFTDGDLKTIIHPNLSGLYLKRSMSDAMFDAAVRRIFIDLLGDASLAAIHGKRIFMELFPDPVTPRQAMQLVGTEGFRKINDRVWIDYVLDQAAELIGQGSSVVIADVRYPNEMDAVRESGGLIIGIKRISAEYYEHSSEEHIDSMIECCNHVFVNNDTINALYAKVDQLPVFSEKVAA